MIRRLLLSALLAGLALLGPVAAQALAAPVWRLDIHHNPTNFSHQSGQYWFDLSNIGDSSSSGTVTLTIELPPGVFAREGVASVVGAGGSQTGGFQPNWSCPGAPGQTTVTCTTTNVIPRHTVARGLVLSVGVFPSAGGDPVTTASVSGGGAAQPATAAEPTHVSDTPASFGFAPGTWLADFFEADAATPVRQAGSHPHQTTFAFDMNSEDAPRFAQPLQKAPVEHLRRLTVDMPPGFVGNLTAVEECSTADFEAVGCPASSQVGRIDVTLYPATSAIFDLHSLPVFNIAHPPGVLNDLGFNASGNPIHLRASLDPARNYAVRTTIENLNESLPPFSSNLTIWGYPKDPAHDSERCSGGAGIATSSECSSNGPEKAFLTTPFDCATSNRITLSHYSSWEESAVFGPDVVYDLPGAPSGCDQVPFAPTVSIAPTNDVADSPSGLDLQIELPQDEDPSHIATSPLRDATVTLPEGLTVNPAAANGLAACSPAQIALGSDDPVRCPDASQIGSARIITPALPNPIDGLIYLATQRDNPFGSLFAGYIVLSDPDRDILVKIPGRIDVNRTTGRLTGSFKENPQLPFSHLELHFKAGAHASLITPSTCGDYETASELRPWSGTAPVTATNGFAISQSADGGACPREPASLRNSPSFDAGTVSPISKSYSPFVLHLRREDGTQRFAAFNVTLPQGLTGKLAGTALCPDGALAAAEAKSGKEEQASPSCSAGSHVGEVVAAVGAGPSPYNARGDAYLAGPYKGAPVSLAVVTPAVAGPFDLGTIVIRTPLRIDPATAQITAVSDPIPQMLEGIPTTVRSVDVVMDRPDFTLTGTSCDPTSFVGTLTPTLGRAAPLSARYQLSDCSRLRFKPKISLSLRGDTERGGHPALTVVLKPRPGDANIASLSLAMPHSEFLDQGHIRTVCTRVQFAADACPAAAVYGHASVQTPLLGYPLSGNVYLRSSNNLLPDLVPDLRGPSYQPIEVEAAGRTDSIHGGLRNSFDFVPDAPFSKLVTKLPGGKKGLLQNSRDICARTYRATVKYTAHNGAAYVDHPKLRVKCKGKKQKRHKRDQRAAR